MKCQLWLAGFGIAALLVSCSGGDQNAQTSTPPSAANPTKDSPGISTQPFSNPTVNPTATVRVPAVPELLRSTNATAHLAKMGTGRQDPFAALQTGPFSVSLPAPSLAKPKAVQSARRVPVTPRGSLPPLLPLPSQLPNQMPSPSGSGSLPPVQIPTQPPAAPPSPTALADAVEITGVIQVGKTWNVIIKEPNSASSRHVRVGEYVANGKVLVKRIVAAGTAEPRVVLQQGGKEITKEVGSTIASIAFGNIAKP